MFSSRFNVEFSHLLILTVAVFLPQFQTDLHHPGQRRPGQILGDGHRHRRGFLQPHSDRGRWVASVRTLLWLHGSGLCCSCWFALSPSALNTMLELSHAIRNPSERRRLLLHLFLLPLLWISPDLVFLSPCSRSSETRPELRDSGEGTRAILAAGHQTVPISVLQVHRQRQGGHQWGGTRLLDISCSLAQFFWGWGSGLGACFMSS